MVCAVPAALLVTNPLPLVVILELLVEPGLAFTVASVRAFEPEVEPSPESSLAVKGLPARIIPVLAWRSAPVPPEVAFNGAEKVGVVSVRLVALRPLGKVVDTDHVPLATWATPLDALVSSAVPPRAAAIVPLLISDPAMLLLVRV